MKSTVRRRWTPTDDYLAGLTRMVRSAGRRVGREDPEQLAQLCALRDTLEDAIIDAVRGLRQSGFTWQSIGDATGTTREAAFQKWDRRSKQKGAT